MPKVAALEFNDSMVRGLVAKTAGSSFQVTSAFEVELDASWEDSQTNLGESLTKALGNTVGRCDALVSFGRGQSELRVLNVPVVPNDELPEIVRFQALRQFTNAQEDSPVDFLPLSESSDEKRVLAATVPLDVIKRLSSGCQAAGLTVKEMKLRATCTTALSQHIAPERKNYVIVEPTDRSFNLEVVAYGKLCLTRTVRSSGDPTTQILREIRRTLAAANNQIQGYEAKSVVVFGNEEEFEGLRKAIGDELHFDVDFVNPFDHASGLSSPPENPGQYASLVGLLVSHCTPSGGATATETIDFLNPRRKSVDRSNNRVAMLAGIAAATLFIGLGIIGYMMLASKTSKIEKLRAEIQSKSESDKVAKELIADVEQIEAFENNQAIWLKELANISERFLEPDHAILNGIAFNLDLKRSDGKIRIDANGYLQSGEISEKIANLIREHEKYDASLEDVTLLSESEKDQDIYSHKFKASVFRGSELLIPEVDDETLKAYMEPRIELGKKELETSAKLAEDADGSTKTQEKEKTDDSENDKTSGSEKELSNE